MLKIGYSADPKRTDDGALEPPARGYCPHGWLELGPAQLHSPERGSSLSYPGNVTDGDGTDDRECLSLHRAWLRPFKMETR